MIAFGGHAIYCMPTAMVKHKGSTLYSRPTRRIGAAWLTIPPSGLLVLHRSGFRRSKEPSLAASGIIGLAYREFVR